MSAAPPRPACSLFRFLMAQQQAKRPDPRVACPCPLINGAPGKQGPGPSVHRSVTATIRNDNGWRGAGARSFHWPSRQIAWAGCRHVATRWPLESFICLYVSFDSRNWMMAWDGGSL